MGKGEKVKRDKSEKDTSKGMRRWYEKGPQLS